MKKGRKTQLLSWSKGKWFDLIRKNPVIIIDPGHGYIKGSTGTASWLCTYKNKEKPTENLVSNVLNLPQYVIDDPNQWIVSTREDPNLSERFLVYEVSAKLKTILDSKG